MEWGAVMDWNYKPVRTVPLEDIAQAVHDTVTMQEAVRFYLPHVLIRNNRCPCPFHHGKDLNFSFTQHGYKCFVCGATGDVISFVKDICECSTRLDAIRRINSDFRLNLPVDGEIDYQQSLELAKRRAEAEKKAAEQTAWDAEYNHLIAEYARLDGIIMRNKDISFTAQARELMGYINYRLDSLPPRPK